MTAHKISRRSFLTGALAFAALSAASLSGCGSKTSKVKVGTMPTEDILPLWVAEQEGLFSKHNVEVEIVPFDSAQNLSAAITAKEVDLAMTDPMRAVKLCESGTALSMEWITLGTTAQQGRFGVLTAANSGFTTLADLLQATKGVGVAANTVPEYVFDKLCEQAGIDPSQIKTSEVPSLPERYSLASAGSLDAAALPGSMLALGEVSGMVVLADDTQGDNVSQSVMVARTEYKEGEGAAGIESLRAVWDEAADLVNANPENYRALLAQKANLNDAVVDSYPICEYPHASTDAGTSAYPPADLIEPQIEWMKQKGYATSNVAYDETTGTFQIS